MLIGEVFEEPINVVQKNNRYTIRPVNGNVAVTLCNNKAEVERQISVNRLDKHDTFFEVHVKGQDSGLLWVSDNDESLPMISRLLNKSLIVRLIYETGQRTLNQKVAKDDGSMKYILNAEGFDMNHVLGLLDELEIDRDEPRVTTYVVHDEGFDTKDIMRLKIKPDSREVVYSPLSSKYLLVSKDLPETYQSSTDFKPFIRDYTHNLQEWEVTDCYYFIGSIQERLRQYTISYQSYLWLRGHVICGKNTPVSFSDYSYDYFLSKVAMGDIRDVFDYCGECREDIDVEEMVDICDELLVNDFNLTQAADDLSLHRNASVYELREYEGASQIGAWGNSQGKVLLMLISYALRRYRKRAQVGNEA